jgi:DNA transformation protein
MAMLAEDLLGGLPEFEARRMFGAYGLYTDGTMFGILDRGVFYFKVDPITRPSYEALGSSAFRPSPTQTLHSYYRVPGEWLDDDRELLARARQAAAIGQAAPEPRQRARRRRSKPGQH